MVMLSGRVRQERLRLGWTQADAAGRVGISRRSYQRFEQAAAITLAKLDRVLAAFGLGVALAPATGVAVPSPDARLQRQRGLRHAAPPVAAEAKPAASAAPVKPPPPAATNARPTVVTSPLPSAPAAASIDPARVVDLTRRLRDRVFLTIYPIVAGAQTNYTAYGVVENIMNTTPGLSADDRPVFVAAVVAQLNALTPEKLPIFGINRSTYDRWLQTWSRDLGIIDPVTGAAL